VVVAIGNQIKAAVTVATTCLAIPGHEDAGWIRYDVVTRCAQVVSDHCFCQVMSVCQAIAVTGATVRLVQLAI
jgi:hypothetical protein